jgi:hypothetical protein
LDVDDDECGFLFCGLGHFYSRLDSYGCILPMGDE